MTNFRYNNKSKIVVFKLPLKYANQLRKLWDKSNEERVEYAGILAVKHTTSNLHYLRFSKLATSTSYQRGQVSGAAANFATTEYVSMHSHPSFGKPGLKKNTPTEGFYFTTPSEGDFNFYLYSLANQNKKNQCNIVLDKHGFWVVDLLKVLEIGEPYNGREVYERIVNLLEPTNAVQSGSGKGLAKSVVSNDNFLYWKCPDLKSWAKATKKIGDTIFKEFGIKITYHFWPGSKSNLSYIDKEAELRFKIA
jgi:hypothetical protein